MRQSFLFWEAKIFYSTDCYIHLLHDYHNSPKCLNRSNGYSRALRARFHLFHRFLFATQNSETRKTRGINMPSWFNFNLINNVFV